jgi:hypothetical protein
MYRPVLSGFWKQHELFDGTYTVMDLFDAHDILDMRGELER